MEKFTEWLNAERGRRSLLAAECKITHGAISQWDRIPAERVLEVERITGISRHELRPDIFGERETAA
jgi:DNA-binding transcriptional regulator YdaS (Cro superfamily)